MYYRHSSYRFRNPSSVASVNWGFLRADHVEANALAHSESDPLSLQPELSITVVDGEF